MYLKDFLLLSPIIQSNDLLKAIETAILQRLLSKQSPQAKQVKKEIVLYPSGIGERSRQSDFCQLEIMLWDLNKNYAQMKPKLAL